MSNVHRVFIPINDDDTEKNMNARDLTREAARRIAMRAAGRSPDPSPSQIRAAQTAAPPIGMPPSPAELEKIAAIAAIVGTDGADPAATLAACEALMGSFAVDEAAARRQLSARERAMLGEMRGVSAVAYLAQKRGAR